jgi:hypothetical protein
MQQQKIPVTEILAPSHPKTTSSFFPGFQAALAASKAPYKYIPVKKIPKKTMGVFDMLKIGVYVGEQAIPNVVTGKGVGGAVKTGLTLYNKGQLNTALRNDFLLGLGGSLAIAGGVGAGVIGLGGGAAAAGAGAAGAGAAGAGAAGAGAAGAGAAVAGGIAAGEIGSAAIGAGSTLGLGAMALEALKNPYVVAAIAGIVILFLWRGKK